MSDKDRKKKDGQNTDKKNHRMRAAELERHENAVPSRRSADDVDNIKFKSGSENDRTTRNQQGSTS